MAWVEVANFDGLRLRKYKINSVHEGFLYIYFYINNNIDYKRRKTEKYFYAFSDS